MPGRGWVWSTTERAQEEIEKGNLVFGVDENTILGVRMTLFESDSQVMRNVIFSYAQKASQDFAALFDGRTVFDNPKSAIDIKRLVQYMTRPGDLILDSFAGSGTTGDAVYAANTVTKAQRRFITIQIPQPIRDDTDTGKSTLELGLKTISDITEERFRRAAAKLKSENPLPALATNGVHYAAAYDPEVLHVFTAGRHHTDLDHAGRLLSLNNRRHLRPGREMAVLFRDVPGAVAQTLELSSRLRFQLDDQNSSANDQS